MCNTECKRHGSCDTLPTAISSDVKGNERHGESKEGLNYQSWTCFIFSV